LGPRFECLGLWKGFFKALKLTELLVFIFAMKAKF
jgi:hypothetical protein